MNKKVSIITTTYNDCVNLQKIIDRVKKQDYDNLEYIIVDGASKDDTLEIIKKEQLFFGEKLKWISEPDHGIYDAINKGISMATGDVIGVIFDEFTSDQVLSKIMSTIFEQNVDGVHADIDYVQNEKIIRKWRMGKGKIQNGWMPGHPTLYLKKEVYEKFGLYKTDYKIAADYEFMIRILKDNQVTLTYIPEVLVRMFYGGESASTGGFSNYMRSLKEGHRALKENKIKFAVFVDCLRTIRVLLQFI